jgi:hypothetical protein
MSVPVTVYVVFTPGLTDAVLVVTLPAFALHVYVLAPLAESTSLCPAHILVLAGDTVSVGNEFTLTVIVVESTHPAPVLPTIVKVVVVVKVGVTEAPARPPGIHV